MEILRHPCHGSKAYQTPCRRVSQETTAPLAHRTKALLQVNIENGILCIELQVAETMMELEKAETVYLNFVIDIHILAPKTPNENVQVQKTTS